MAEEITIAQLEAWLRHAAVELKANAELLTELDSAIGDADHGTNMTRGFNAIIEKLDSASPATVQALVKSVGMTVVSKVGGASGSLYGTFFLDMGRNSPATETMTPAELETALRAGIAGVVGRGHAQVGDKTMIDALEPAIDALSAALEKGDTVAVAAGAAAAAARAGSDSTKPLVARKGRASYLGDRSAGHLDPGSVSATILLESLRDVLGEDAA